MAPRVPHDGVSAYGFSVPPGLGEPGAFSPENFIIRMWLFFAFAALCLGMNTKSILKMQSIPYNFFEWNMDELFEARTQKGGVNINVAVRQKKICFAIKKKMLVFPIMSRCQFCLILIEVHR